MKGEIRTRGVMYVAWGKAHVDVARRSAASVKRHNPGLQAAIWCAADAATSAFDQSCVIPPEITRRRGGALKFSP